MRLPRNFGKIASCLAMTALHCLAVTVWSVLRHCEETFVSMRCIELKRAKNVFVAISRNLTSLRINMPVMKCFELKSTQHVYEAISRVKFNIEKKFLGQVYYEIATEFCEDCFVPRNDGIGFQKIASCLAMTALQCLPMTVWSVQRHCGKTFASMRCFELKRAKNVFVAISLDYEIATEFLKIASYPAMTTLIVQRHFQYENLFRRIPVV